MLHDDLSLLQFELLKEQLDNSKGHLSNIYIISADATSWDGEVEDITFVQREQVNGMRKSYIRLWVNATKEGTYVKQLKTLSIPLEFSHLVTINRYDVHHYQWKIVIPRGIYLE